jgi:hypothetical protein
MTSGSNFVAAPVLSSHIPGDKWFPFVTVFCCQNRWNLVKVISQTWSLWSIHSEASTRRVSPIVIVLRLVRVQGPEGCDVKERKWPLHGLY